MPDLTVTATSVVNTNAQVGTGIAGETIIAGQALYLKSADSRLWKAQCDGTTEEGTPIGIALNGGSAGQTISYGFAGTINIGATTVKTTTYMLSATAGGVAPQADLIATNKIIRLGHATDITGAFIIDIKATGAVV